MLDELRVELVEAFEMLQADPNAAAFEAKLVNLSGLMIRAAKQPLRHAG